MPKFKINPQLKSLRVKIRKDHNTLLDFH